MADRFYLDEPGVERNANGVRGIQQDLQTSLDELRAVLDRRHGCWGTDDIGKGFGDNYVPGETDSLEYVSELVTGLGYYADGLVGYAAQLAAVDQRSAAELDRLDADGIREQQREQRLEQQREQQREQQEERQQDGA